MSSAVATRGVLTGRKVLVIVLTFFGVIIAVNATMTVLAVETLSGTEVASAYNASLAYQNEIAAAQRQDDRHWQVSAAARRDASGNVSVNIVARDSHGEPLNGLQMDVHLQRPVDKRFDRDAALVEQGAGTYAVRFADVAAGQWDLVIEAERDGAAMFRSRSRIVLN
jgi:nitrogen fixation protein FixH